MNKYVSVQAKILIPLAVIFLVTMGLVSAYSANQQKQEAVINSTDNTTALINAYMDSLNAMMFSGSMAMRETLRQKIMSQEEVKETRVLRGEAVTNLFGPGFDSEKPVDELDRKGLNGERSVVLEKIEGERVLTIVQPFFASENHNGTNCLSCHNVPENTLLGAIRMSYSLGKIDSAVEKGIWTMLGINVAIFAVGLVLIGLLVRSVVISPLRQVRQTMSAVAANTDLSLRIHLKSHDEFKDVGLAINEMLDHFSLTIKDLINTGHRLSRSSDQLLEVADQTQHDISDQEQQVHYLTTAIEQMSEAARDVAENSASAKAAAQQALDDAIRGKLQVDEVAASIKELANKVEGASTVVTRLAEGTEQIRNILGAITGIAEQTNLLALNAAIEAARAGDQGRGFAVVADEVRNLAMRTQKETQEINNTIQRLNDASEEAIKVMADGVDQAATNVDQARQANSALEAITLAVSDITDLNTRIATAVEEQSAVAQEINRNIHTINKISESSNQGATRTAETGRDVSEVTDSLNQLVNRFRV
ncbi:methyl-accepting chemotaxis protein [Gynuella sunshinyii]|uniref:Methyl-accepting chemotaxis protein n=1 Tax=Gynuella sunshinyii YC6258 TaxID=1445510 RepID=A0A0C5V2H8_9GAMM|nr:methyl-accepting chemotaxis protein [Gynuella sunshinyii]AJQ93695.1 methyl-accepting chemotaxis protein [Gynuella sunshinyii YC6258]